MAWKDTLQVVGTGVFAQFKDDNESHTIVFLSEPIPRESTYQNRKKHQAAFPVLCDGELKVWTVGQRNMLHIRDNWNKYLKRAVKVTRHGVPNSQSTTYDFKPVTTSKALQAIIDGLKPVDISQILTSAHRTESPADISGQFED